MNVDSLSHQFGEATEGEYLEHTFVVSNDGPAAVEIASAQSNCDCVTVQLSQKQIASGDKANLKVRFDTLGRQGDQDRKVTISFAPAAVQPIELRVHARVEPAVALSEDEDDEEEAEDMFVGEDATRVFHVVGKSAAAAHLAITEVTNPNIAATIVDDPASGGKVVRALIHAPELGHFHAKIVLATGLERTSTVVRNIDWSVRSNVTTNPVSLHFETDGPSGVVGAEERMAVIKSRLSGFVVRSAKSQSPAFAAKVAPGSEAGTYEVRVRVAHPEALSPNTVTSIELSTNDKVEPLLRLPISVSARRSTAGRRDASQPARP